MFDRASTFLAITLLTFAAMLPAQRARRSGTPRPPTVRWQRTLADAEAVAKALGQPLLLCVNMNGEPASEQLASGRYTSPEFAALVTGFVAVIASPDRHTPNDYDAQGRRILCPRFGCVTCGEHIQIEPAIFAKYFKSNRVAPRHMGIGVDGATLFDIFLTNDLATIDAALQKHGRKPVEGATVPAAESSLRERAEAAYQAADAAGRLTLLAAAADATHRPYDILRMGMKEGEPALATAARKALAAIADAGAQAMLIELLDDEDNRQARAELVPTLARIADDKPETRLALQVHQAMVREPACLDAKAWLAALEAPPPPVPAPAEEDLEARLDRLTAAAIANPKDAAVLTELADAHLRFVKQRLADGRDIRFVLVDAWQAAANAIAAKADDWRAGAIAAEVAQLQGERALAAEHARRALSGLREAGLAASPGAAAVLVGLAEGASEAIYAAEAKKAKWEGELLAEADAAYGVLLAHPAGTAAHVAAHAKLLGFLGLRGAARAVLKAGVIRFAADVALHDALRLQIANTRGFPELTAVYDEVSKVGTDVASLRWFAGRAELSIAEFHKRAGADQPALAAYLRALAAFEASRRENPDYAASATWYEAVAQAGRARVCLDLDDLSAAEDAIGDAIARLPAIAEQEDGLGRTPLFTLKQVWAKLGEKGDETARTRLAERVRTAAPAVWTKVDGG